VDFGRRGGEGRAGQLITRRVSGFWDRSLKGRVWVMFGERPVVWAIREGSCLA